MAKSLAQDIFESLALSNRVLAECVIPQRRWEYPRQPALCADCRTEITDGRYCDDCWNRVAELIGEPGDGL